MQNHSIYQDSLPNTNNILNAAVYYQELGYKIIPIVKGTKVPSKKYKTRERYSLEDLQNDFENTDLAIATGGDMHLLCLDFDVKNVEDPKAFMQAVKEAVPDYIYNRLVIHGTPSGGEHWLIHTPCLEKSFHIARNEKGEVTIETKGNGGIVQVPPSVGYTQGKNSMDKIPFLVHGEWDLMLKILISFNQKKPKPVVIKPMQRLCPTTDTPWDIYNACAPADELIRSFGFEESSHDSVKIFYKHPNSNGVQCANWHEGRRCFYIFSTSIGLLEADKGYSLFELLKIKAGGFNQALAIAKQFHR